jgi:hypothetical protein
VSRRSLSAAAADQGEPRAATLGTESRLNQQREPIRTADDTAIRNA